MRIFVRMATAVALIGYALTLPAAAENGTSPANKKVKDPNEVVCEKQEVLGSRLAVKKICMTRAEWTLQRQSARALVDKSQIGSCAKQAGC